MISKPSTPPYFGFRIPIPIPIPLPCIDSSLPWCNIVVVIEVGGSGGSQSGPPVWSCPQSVERGARIFCGFLAGSGAGAVYSNWRFVADDGRTIPRGSTGGDGGDPRIWSGTMVISGTLYVDVRWQGQPFAHPPHRITVLPRNWRSSFPNPQFVYNRYNANLTVAEPPNNESEVGKYEAVAQNYGDVVAISSGPNGGYSYARRAPAFVYRWTGSDALFISGSEHYAQFEAAHCGSYSATNPLGFATARQAREDITRHESGDQNGHYAFFVAALAQPDLNLGLIAEKAVEFGAPALFVSRIDPLVTSAWNRIKELGDAEPCGAPKRGDGKVRGPSCEVLGLWNLKAPTSLTPFGACP